MAERRKTERRVAAPRIQTTRERVIKAVKSLQWTGPLPNWTVIVDGQELPARSLLLKAAGVSSHNPTDSELAAVILSDLGFEVRYRGTTIPWEDLPA